MASGYDRLFTPDEATSLLPGLIPLVKEMMDSRAHLVRLQPALAPVLEKLLGNGGSRFGPEVLEAFEKLRHAVRSIEALGVVIKDMEIGLLDFPADRQGEIVFLCWHYGEAEVAHWHPLDSGFAGRRPL